MKKYIVTIILILSLCISGCSNTDSYTVSSIESETEWAYFDLIYHGLQGEEYAGFYHGDSIMLPGDFFTELSSDALRYEKQMTADLPDECYFYVNQIKGCMLNDGSYMVEKTYEMTMSQGTGGCMREIYSVKDGEYRFLRSIKTNVLIKICSGNYMYYADDIFLHRISPDGYSDVLLDGRIPAPEDAADKSKPLKWSLRGTTLSGEGDILTVNAQYRYKSKNGEERTLEKSYQIDISKITNAADNDAVS